MPLSKEWEDYFTGVSQVVLPRVISDHCPIKLCPNAVDWGPKPFRFENCWLMHRDFVQMAHECWSRTVVEGFARFRLSKEL